MGGIRFYRCGCQSEDPFVLARNPHNGLAREIFHETVIGREKEGPRVNRGDQGREQDSQQKSGEADSQEEEAEIDESTEQGSWQKRAGARTCGLRSRLADMRGWVSVPCGFVGISLEHTLADGQRAAQKCPKLLPSCAWS